MTFKKQQNNIISWLIVIFVLLSIYPSITLSESYVNTKIIKDDATGGDCYLIGVWNWPTKTCTLTTDIYESIKIDSDGITLDGNGHTITGPGGNIVSYGIYLHQKTDIIISNININKFWNGIYLYYSNNNTFINITAFNNYYTGVFLKYSNYNILSNNTISDNSITGIMLHNSRDNNLIHNNVSNNGWSGIYAIAFAVNNTIINNTVSNNNFVGIYLYNFARNNIITNNTVSDNPNGISIYDRSTNNSIINNIVLNNNNGVLIDFSNDNKIYNNNFINNLKQAYVNNSVDNIFNLNKPAGGNYWSDWTGPDNNKDGFVDYPYVFYGGQDNLPWINQDGWEIQGAIERLDIYIQNLPEVAFKNNPIQRKKTFSNKLTEVLQLINEGEYQDAINKLQNDIRAKADGFIDGNLENDWIIDAEAQQEIIAMVDTIIIYLK